MVILGKIYSWNRFEVLSLLMPIKCASLRDPFMVLNKSQGLGTFVLIVISKSLVSLEIQMNLVYTRKSVGAHEPF